MASEPRDQTTTEKLASSVSLLIIARLAIVLSLPVGGLLAVRALNTVDEISRNVSSLRDQVSDAAWTIKLVKQNQETQDRSLSDHEHRLRTLENYAARRPPTAEALPQ